MIDVASDYNAPLKKKKTHTGVQFIILSILLFFCVIILLCTYRLLNQPKTSESNNFIAPQKNSLGATTVSSTTLRKRDCDVELVYSVTDAECDAICHRPKTYESRNGVCVHLAYNNPENPAGCNPKRGTLAYVLGNGEFGTTKMFCLSSDVGIQPDDPLAPNILCGNGKIDIDYEKEFPLLRHCQCSPSQFLALIPATSSTRRHGICVDNKYKIFYETNNLVFEK